MACCKCCCGGEDCTEGQQGKCCCGGGAGACCNEGQYCCDGICVEECAEGEGGCLCGEECCPEGNYCCDGVCSDEPCEAECEADVDCPNYPCAEGDLYVNDDRCCPSGYPWPRSQGTDCCTDSTETDCVQSVNGVDCCGGECKQLPCDP